jgi:hypothetical protein
MSIERQARRIPLDRIIVAGIAGLLLLFPLRLLSFVLLAVFGILVASFARCRQKQFLLPAAAVLAVSLFLPFDVTLGGYYFGVRRGTSSGGPHLVPFVVGMPMPTHLIQHHGEYISAGCMWPALPPPQWILVWD